MTLSSEVDVKGYLVLVLILGLMNAVAARAEDEPVGPIEPIIAFDLPASVGGGALYVYATGQNKGIVLYTTRERELSAKSRVYGDVDLVLKGNKLAIRGDILIPGCPRGEVLAEEIDVNRAGPYTLSLFKNSPLYGVRSRIRDGGSSIKRRIRSNLFFRLAAALPSGRGKLSQVQASQGLIHANQESLLIFQVTPETGILFLYDTSQPSDVPLLYPNVVFSPGVEKVHVSAAFTTRGGLTEETIDTDIDPSLKTQTVEMVRRVTSAYSQGVTCPAGIVDPQARKTESTAVRHQSIGDAVVREISSRHPWFGDI